MVTTSDRPRRRRPHSRNVLAMAITLQPLEAGPELTKLISRQPLQPFLQSWAWGDFQTAYGRRVFRLGAFDHGLVGALTLIEHQLVLGQTYLYAPRGPLAESAAAATALFQAAIKLGRQEKSMYVKVDPALYDFEFDLDKIEGYEPGTTLQEPDTLVLSLKPTADELLSAMHPKTRYNIRLAEKRGVTVRWSTTDRDHDAYLALQKDMAARQGIRLHPDRYYRLMFETLRMASLGELAVAELDGQALAINLMVWHQQTAVFNHGGSSQAHKDVMAPYLLQWRSIQRAKEQGMHDYDFRGIAPANAPDHKLAGVSRFKLGFGGRRVTYPDARNAILDRRWWQMYRLAKRVRGGVDE